MAYRLPFMRAWGTVLSAVALSVMLLAAAACGGDDSDDPTSAGSATPGNEEMVKAMVLTLDDLPVGLQDLGGEVITNEQAAEGAVNPEAELKRLETWGRELGYSAKFILSPDADESNPFLAFQSDASLYEDGQGAGFSYRDDVTEAQAADWLSSFPQLENVEATELDASAIGDDAYWIRVTGFTRDEPKTLFVIDQIVFRTDRVRGFLRSDSQFNADAPRDSGQGQVLGWAQLAGDRVREALAAEAE
jgi:hypothetical protein